MLALVGGEVDAPANLGIRKASSEKGAASVPITFSGARDFTVVAGVPLVKSDWIESPVVAGDILWHRQEADIASGASTYGAGRLFNMASLEGGAAETSVLYDPANEVDDVDATGTMAVPTGSSANYTPPLPVVLIVETAPGVEAYLSVADSIGFGITDLPSSNGANGNGFIARAAYKKGKPHTSVSLSGQTVQQINAGNSLIRALLPLHTHVISEAGTNDLAQGITAATLHARKVTEWAMYKAAGQKVVQPKMLPRVTTADFGTTLAGQTPIAGFGLGGERDILNALYAADVGTLIDKFVDVASAVEEPTDRSKWALPTFTTTFSATALTTATTLSLAASPPIGGMLTADPGGANQGPAANTSPNTRVLSVTGTGPYVATFGAAIGGTTTHAIGEVVKAARTDGTHPEGPVNDEMATLLAAAL